MATPTYEKFQRALMPLPLAGESGQAYAGVLGREKDAQLERAKDAVRARFPSRAPADALPLLGLNVQLERGPDEPEDAYRARLRDAFNAWRWAGTRKGILEYALAPAGFENAALITNRQWTPAPPDGQTAKWARFWAVIAEPHPWEPTYIDGTWTVEADTTSTIGSTATLNDVMRVRRLLQAWKSARDVCMGAVIVFGDATAPDAIPGAAPWNEYDLTFDGDTCIFWPS